MWSYFCQTVEISDYFCQTVDMSDHWHVRLPACNWNIVSAKTKTNWKAFLHSVIMKAAVNFFFKNLTLDGCRYHFFQKLDFFFFFNSKSYSNHHIVTESWMDMPPNVFVHAPPPPPPPKKKKKKKRSHWHHKRVRSRLYFIPQTSKRLKSYELWWGGAF